MKNVYLAGAVRTPIGKFGGTLASWTAADLGVAVAKESLRRARCAGGANRRFDLGLCASGRWWTKRRAANHISRGVPETVPAFTVNQACGSGLKAIILAAQEIMLVVPTRFLLAARKACRVFLILQKARAGACGWETRSWLMACTATDSTIHCQDW